MPFIRLRTLVFCVFFFLLLFFYQLRYEFINFIKLFKRLPFHFIYFLYCVPISISLCSSIFLPLLLLNRDLIFSSFPSSIKWKLRSLISSLNTTYFFSFPMTLADFLFSTSFIIYFLCIISYTVSVSNFPCAYTFVLCPWPLLNP